MRAETGAMAGSGRAMLQPLSENKSYKELALRIASALVLIPLVVLATVWGSWLFLVLVSVAVALLAVEWGLMTAPRYPGRMAISVTLGILAALFAGVLDRPVSALTMLVFGAVASALYARAMKGAPADAAYGVLYIGLPAFGLIWLRGTPDGLEWALFAFIVAWSSDSAAYLIGKLLGGPKLWRRISPKKTWSGFAGGMMAGLLSAVALSDVTGLFSSATMAALIGLLTALATMAGDLWESMLKRRYGVKDSGHLIPGHGGLLDRVDGLMFAVLAVVIVRLAGLAGGGV